MKTTIEKYAIDNAEALLRETLNARAMRSSTLSARSARYGLGMSPAELAELREFDRLPSRGSRR